MIRGVHTNTVWTAEEILLKSAQAESVNVEPMTITQSPILQ
jgi:hypothetical protein